jgi:hypothetical protein
MVTFISEQTTLGWGFSTDQNNEVDKPKHIGTISQVLEAIKNDSDYNAIRYNQNCPVTWFIDGNPIKTVNHDSNKGMWCLHWLIGRRTADYRVEY